MIDANKPFVALFLTCAAVFACGGTRTPPEAPPEADQPAASPNQNGATRSELTAEACETGGGSVVGDIGDGAIHRPEYRCPSGAQPSGTIRPAAGGPISVEGSVCCPK